jgi:hypothetical protein
MVMLVNKWGAQHRVDLAGAARRVDSGIIAVVELAFLGMAV